MLEAIGGRVDLVAGTHIGGTQTETLLGIENVVGSAVAEEIVGTAVANRLEGGAGNDTLYGVDGDDSLYGGDGDDRLVGGIGLNVLDGGAGNDTVSYVFSQAAASIHLPSQTVVIGGVTELLVGIENVIGSNRANTITGSNGANYLEGLAGNDKLVGGIGNDTLLAGRDTLGGGVGNDSLTGALGADRFSFDTLLIGGAEIDAITDYSKAEGDVLFLYLPLGGVAVAFFTEITGGVQLNLLGGDIIRVMGAVSDGDAEIGDDILFV